MLNSEKQLLRQGRNKLLSYECLIFGVGRFKNKHSANGHIAPSQNNCSLYVNTVEVSRDDFEVSIVSY